VPSTTLTRGHNFVQRHAWLIVVLLCFASMGYTYWSIDKQRSRGRADVCQVFEAQYRTKALRLQRTYDYILTLNTEEKRDKLNRVIIQGLSTDEQDVRAAVPPSFCNQPGTDNIPPIPHRPAEL
jgi:hypothetical protein